MGGIPHRGTENSESLNLSMCRNERTVGHRTSQSLTTIDNEIRRAR